jgi:hypothetical protein
MIYALKPSDQVARTNFAVDMLERIDASPDFLHQVCFSDEVTFHVNGVVNRYNCRFWGSQNPHVTCELERGNPEVNVWASLMHDKLIGRFFFLEKTVTKCSYLDMLELYVLPQQDGVPPHLCHHVRNHVDREMAGKWIGRGGPIAWPPRSPELTPLDFFLWGCVKKFVFQVKTNDLQHLKTHIRDAVAMVTPNVLQATRNEVEYHLDICRAIKGGNFDSFLLLV